MQKADKRHCKSSAIFAVLLIFLLVAVGIYAFTKTDSTPHIGIPGYSPGWILRPSTHGSFSNYREPTAEEKELIADIASGRFAHAIELLDTKLSNHRDLLYQHYRAQLRFLANMKQDPKVLSEMEADIEYPQVGKRYADFYRIAQMLRGGEKDKARKFITGLPDEEIAGDIARIRFFLTQSKEQFMAEWSRVVGKNRRSASSEYYSGERLLSLCACTPPQTLKAWEEEQGRSLFDIAMNGISDDEMYSSNKYFKALLEAANNYSNTQQIDWTELTALSRYSRPTDGPVRVIFLPTPLIYLHGQIWEGRLDESIAYSLHEILLKYFELAGKGTSPGFELPEYSVMQELLQRNSFFLLMLGADKARELLRKSYRIPPGTIVYFPAGETKEEYQWYGYSPLDWTLLYLLIEEKGILSNE